MKTNKIIKSHFPFLKGLESQEIIFNKERHPSLASAIVDAKLPYKPGVYLVYDFNNNELGDLLYVGKAGADKAGKINAHQLPKRLLAVCYPPKKYLTGIKSKHPSRNKAWPKMMEEDKIDSIKIFCFFSRIDANFRVDIQSNPLTLESEIRKMLNTKPLWAKR